MLVCLKHEIPLNNSLVSLDNARIHYYAANQVELEIDKNTYSENWIDKSLALAEEIAWLSQNYVEFKGMTWLRNLYKSLLIKRGFITKYSPSQFKYHERQLADAFREFYGEQFIQVIHPKILDKLETYLEYCLFSCDITQTIDRITHVLIIKFLCGSIKNVFD